ncbi:MAG: DUF2851 family protein [Microscillaceae bacterium]|jgi:hypothetical protein|nr:DUF2851 family protein [Microscillaceae bacterium]
MTEDFIQFIWQYQYFDKTKLKTTQDQDLVVLEVGNRNIHAGADYYYTKILLDDMEWVGNVEFHLKSSSWHTHQHSQNPAYNNVILHVVWQDDKPVLRADHTPIPTLELHHRVNAQWLTRYKQLIHNQAVIPCESQFRQVDNLKKIMMLDKALSQRLWQKSNFVLALLDQNQGDWEETTYQLLAKNFGFKVNSEAFLRLAQNLPYKILLKHRHDVKQLEALLLGQAGFLENLDEPDTYTQKLREEYLFLAHKYQLKPNQLQLSEWKFLRLRPANFPTLRLAQFAQLIYENSSLCAMFLEGEIKDLMNRLNFEVSEYWQNHYQLSKISPQKTAHRLGKSAIENILINTASSLLAGYSQAKANQAWMDKAIQTLENLGAENNQILKMWADLGLKVKTAFDSQALVELYQQFCLPKKCLQCVIGMSLVKQV